MRVVISEFSQEENAEEEDRSQGFDPSTGSDHRWIKENLHTFQSITRRKGAHKILKEGGPSIIRKDTWGKIVSSLTRESKEQGSLTSQNRDVR
jgi:hypothetical protein